MTPTAIALVDRAHNAVTTIQFDETICLLPKDLTRQPSVTQGSNDAWFEFQYSAMNRGMLPLIPNRNLQR